MMSVHEDDVFSCLEKGQLLEADKLAVELYKNDKKRSIAAELLTSIAIEANEVDLAVERCQLLQQEKESSYRLFLQARVCYMQKDRSRAMIFLERALEEPLVKYASPAVLEKVYNLLGQCYRFYGESEKAVQCYFYAAQYTDDIRLKWLEYSNYLFNIHYLYTDKSDYQQANMGYNKLFAGIKKYKWNNNLAQNKDKIRIGYISPDFRNHVVLRFTYVMLTEYDKNDFEVICYSTGREDDFSQKVADKVDVWRNLRGYSAEKIAEIIKQDNVDILFELAGHCNGGNLPVLAYKPAPIQICGIGYFATTGLNAVDYFLTDKYLEPKGNTEFFSEQLLVLPRTHFCYEPLYEVPKPQGAPFRKNGFVTFGSFNNLTKVTDEVLGVWSQIMTQVPESRLLLKGELFDDSVGLEVFQERLLSVNIPLERVELRGISRNYLPEYFDMDIALDTFPYPGGGTTCDALYMGVPVITLTSETHHSRFGYSVLMNLGLGELCAESHEEYVGRAVELATNKDKIQYLHLSLRRIMELSPMMDKGSYMAELETLYRNIWRSKCGKLPQKFTNKYCMDKALEYVNNKDYGKAFWYFQKAAECGGNNLVELYGMMASCASELSDHGRAWNYMKMARKQLDMEEDKGNRGFQYSFINNEANYSQKLGDVDFAVSAYKSAIELADGIEQKSSAYGNYLYALHCSLADWRIVEAAHIGYNKLFTKVRKNILKMKPNDFVAGNKIRIGYMSPDFRQHVMFSFYYTLLACYDHDSFHVICYQVQGKPDGFTDHLKSLVDEWKFYPDYEFEKLAEKIKEDRIDILVDLAGHTAHSGMPVFVYRPAKVQISGLGWMETTGLKETDYLITDTYIDPENDNYITEKPLYLTSQFCYTARNDVPSPQGAPCKQKGYILFGVFNHWKKINDYILGMWLQILEQVPNSKLLLKCQVLSSLSAEQEIFDKLYKFGFDMERIEFEPATNTYMKRYLDVDIALDTYPYPGGGTTCDALYMGVPVVSLYSKRRGSRFGYSILENAGLGELAVSSEEEYVQRAVALAKDWDLLDVLHKNIRGMMIKSPLMDNKHYIVEIEEAYKKILEKSER